MNLRDASSLKGGGAELHFVFAPPGFGKTTGLLQLFRESGVGLVFLSPLRAIAEEVRVRASKEGFLTSWGAREAPAKNLPPHFICSTLESFIPEAFSPEDYLFVIDEFHLLFYWDHFRPHLLETLYALAAMKARVLALSATMKEELFVRVKEEMCTGFERFLLYDLGGNTLLFNPSKKISFHLSTPFEQLIANALYLKLKRQKAIIFCPRRTDVAKVLSILEKFGIKALGCVGGEARAFQEEWNLGDYQVVVATTVLSHGVNLGAIRVALFLYQVPCEDFYLQMLARAGRDGRGFIVMHRQCRDLRELARLPLIKLLAALFILFFGHAKL